MGQRLRSGDILVRTAGDVLDSARDYVRRQVAAFARRLPNQSLSAQVKLTVFARPSVPLPALAQANLSLAGQPVRAQVAAAFFQEAGRLLRTRLGEQVTRLTHPGEPRGWPDTGTHRPEPAPCPPDRRAIARRKCYPLTACTPDQAALTMDVMDYDVHLFVDAETGEDSVVYRVGPTGYRLARLSGMAPPTGPSAVPLTLNPHRVPTLTERHAVDSLNRTELPFQFFRDAETGRGAVLYRRYDGHYGLITPAD